jgi:hypothetical protein
VKHGQWSWGRGGSGHRKRWPGVLSEEHRLRLDVEAALEELIQARASPKWRAARHSDFISPGLSKNETKTNSI